MDNEVELAGVAAFGLLLGGEYRARSAGRVLDTGQPFLFIPGHAAAASHHPDLLLVTVEIDVLRTAAGRRIGADSARLGFHGGSPVSPAMREHWLRTIGWAWRCVIQADDVFRSDLARTAALDAVVRTALAAFPIEAVPVSGYLGETATTASIRRAQRHIEEHPDAPLTVEGIADAARISVRAMQNGFRRELGTTPTAYHRLVRLHHAHDDLAAADVRDVRVADVARRWGFVSMGRFAADYRGVFGQNPAETLRS